MTNIAIETTDHRQHEGIAIRIVKNLATRFQARNEAAELKRLASVPPYLVADMGLPGFHLMPPKARKAAYRAAVRQNA